ncbi:MAG: TPM domain-containing protein [Bacteroidales bacterium]|nr:MAG: TPM domain-containing protein [Bacteroidales bacterium]
MKNCLYLFLLSLLLTGSAVGQRDQNIIPARPVPPRLVNDFADFLTTGEESSLERKLVDFNNETSTQITIVTVPSLEGFDISDFAFRLGENWGVGQEGFDNGIVILVKPKNENEKGEVFIATGYGLEGVVPDAVAKRIVEAEILPSFRKGEYFEGLDKAVTTLLELTRGEYTADAYLEETADNSVSFGIGFFILFIFLISLFSRIRRRRHFSPRHNIPLWTALFLAGSAGRSHGGNFGRFSSGGGSFGGFGGFGGGSFGGGGAGGSW